MHKDRKHAPEIRPEIDLKEEIRKLNEVTEQYSKLNHEIVEMEEILPEHAEINSLTQEQYLQLSEDLRGMQEKLKLVRGEVSMAGTASKNLQDKMEKYVPEKPVHKAWKLAAVLELVVLVAVGAGILILELVRQPAALPADGVPEVTGTPSAGEPQETIYHHVDNLAARAAAIEADDIAPFTAVVEEIDGLEYLSFVYQDLKISYANEYLSREEETAARIRLETKDRLVVYPWEYDLTQNLVQLAPEYGAYTGEEGNQLIFLQYDAGGKQLPAVMRMLDADRLWEYDDFDIRQALTELFALEFSEVPGADGTVLDARMQMTVNSVNYNYVIGQNTYVNAVYYEDDILCFDEYFELLLEDEKMSFTAVVSTADKEYLGEVSGEIAAVNREIVLKNVRYGAYVTPYQEDEGSDGIIQPRTSRMQEHITISGANKERFYIELSDEIERLSYDLTNMKMNEAGFYEYFNEAGEKISVTGIDVSKYQGVIDWKKVREAGVEFAILRLGYRGWTEGTLEIDNYYETNVKAAVEAGVKVGVYFFSQAITVEEAVEEAEFVLEKIRDYDITYPVIFDTEDVPNYNARANNLSRDFRTDICIAFCDTIAAAGYRPMVYASTRWMIMGIDLERLTAYDKWYAYYGTSFTFPYQYQMLQYSDTGSVPGIEGNVDLDISFVDYALEKQMKK